MSDPIRERLPMQVHDLGCRCWPHVSESEAVAVITDVALKSYRDEKRAADERDAERRRHRQTISELQAANERAIAASADSVRLYKALAECVAQMRAMGARGYEAESEANGRAALRAHEEATK